MRPSFGFFHENAQIHIEDKLGLKLS